MAETEGGKEIVLTQDEALRLRIEEKKRAAPPPPPNEKKVKVVFQETDNPTDPRTISISVNGKRFDYERGVEVRVPQSVLRVIDDNPETRYRERKNPTTGQNELIPYQVPRFPYKVIHER